jgi:hypothetical protein
VEKKKEKIVDEKGRDKNQICKCGRRVGNQM